MYKKTIFLNEIVDAEATTNNMNDDSIQETDKYPISHRVFFDRKICKVFHDFYYKYTPNDTK